MTLRPTITAPRRSAIPLALTLLIAALPARGVAPTGCTGDCGADGVVTVNELVTMVTIALGTAPVSACAAGDDDGDGRVAVNELVAAVGHILTGCPAPPSCGGIVGTACPARELCELPAGTCMATDVAGVCTRRPDSCSIAVAPVCGCDGVTYTTDCLRQLAGAALDHDGVCASPLAPQIDALVAAAGIGADTPGAAVMVIHAGHIAHAAGYGLADLEHHVPITPHTIFKIASATKDFTGMGIMMLHEAGKLAYDDPIGTYVSELARFGDDVTIRRVLHHTSGFEDYSNDAAPQVLLLLRNPMPTNADTLALLAESGRLLFTPGERFRYTNTGYEMLAVAIERITGQSYVDYVQTHIFDPLGMTSTFSRPNPDRLSDPLRALGYRDDFGPWMLDDANPFDDLAGASSIYSTAADLFLYDQAQYTDRLVQQQTLMDAFTPGLLNDGSEVRFDLSPDPDDSYGFGRVLGTVHGYPYVESSGDWPGYRAYIGRFIGQQLTVIVLLNRRDIDWITLGRGIAELYLPSVTDRR